MAKLSARGRKEIYRLVKNGADDADTTNNKIFMVLVSDRTVLIKRTFDWKPESAGASRYGGSNHYSSGWTVYSRKKPEVTNEHWLYRKLTMEGWARVE